jgi:hypothetical protein
MNTNQKNKLDMLLAMQAICNSNMAVLLLLPQFDQWFQALGNVVKEIKRLSEAQELDYKGKTETKNSKKNFLINNTMEVVRRTVAYAMVNDLYELKQEVDYTISDLIRCADTELRTICQVVNERATSVLTELASFGVTQAMLEDQQTAINDYFGEITKPREGIIGRKNATSAMKEEFKKADDIVNNRLDKLVAMLKTSNPEVYESYTNARIIIDLGHGKKNGEYKIEGETIDFESGLPLAGVNVSIVGTTTVVMTGPDGLFNIPVKSAGDYALRAEKDGYKVLIGEEVIVGNGQEEVVMEMEKA